MNACYILLVVFINLICLNAYSAVWISTNEWSEAWDNKYSEWIKNDFNQYIFVKGDFKNIPTDCADAVYAARVIFSYKNKLPFVINMPHSSGRFITNSTTKFDKFASSLKRVRSFIRWVNGITNTKSLITDTYPTEINRQALTPGVVYLSPRYSPNHDDNVTDAEIVPGHADLVKEVTPYGIIKLIGTTSPDKVRVLNIKSNLSYIPRNHDGGFRKWMPPRGYHSEVESLPYYSLEQYELGNTEVGQYKFQILSQWVLDIRDRLKLFDESAQERTIRLVQNLCQAVNLRVSAVNEGISYQKKIKNKCMNESEYDDYSTPSRDKKIKNIIVGLFEVTNYYMYFEETVSKYSIELNNCAPIEYYPGVHITLKQYIQRVKQGLISFDPNAPIEARWGETKFSSKRCKMYYTLEN
ncbi:MAG: hypothetical protein ISR65_09960 [Bacteriovoracaceae bacterium]|nr:hypothetical protein [Bacteriovoracaceae bacterium]